MIQKQHNKHADCNHKTTISNNFFHIYRTKLTLFILLYDGIVKSIIYECACTNEQIILIDTRTPNTAFYSSGNAKSTASSSLTGISSFGAVNLSTKSGIKSMILVTIS